MVTVRTSLVAVTVLLLLWSLAAPWSAADSPLVRYKLGAIGATRVDPTAPEARQERCSWFWPGQSFCQARDGGQLLGVRIGALLLVLAGALLAWPRRFAVVVPVLIAAAIALLFWGLRDLLAGAHELTQTDNGSGRYAAFAALLFSAVVAILRDRNHRS